MDRADTSGPGSWPSADRAAELVRRLAAGDPVAPSDFAAAYLDPLVAFLRATNPSADDHAVQDAAEDAIVSLCKNPAQFDPARGELAAYLKMSAAGDLKNLLAREKKHHRNRESWDSVELDAAARNSGDDGADDLPSFDHPALATVIAAFTADERRVFELIRAGERRNEVFAAALGLTHLTEVEWEAEVLRIKDRIKRRLKRAVEGEP
jgi:DNA-directed RNA polymerase specialized sigma24 family protein